MQPIAANDRVFIAGQTGSGKTTASRELLHGINRLIVIDPKDELQGWDLEDANSANMREMENGNPARLRFVPPIEMPEDYYKSIFAFAFAARDLIIYIDEMYAVFSGSNRAVDPLVMTWTRGRSLGVGTWGATQRPAWIPLFSMSESQHFFCFRLMLDEDRARMASLMGGGVQNQIKDEHGFYYRSVKQNQPVYYRSIYQR